MSDIAQCGSVYWITGLSGAGKTTIGRLFYNKLKEIKKNVIFLDGDELREVFGNDLGYTKKDRFQCAMRYARICRLFSQQGIDVIICTISMFEDIRKWNREHNKNYIEIYVQVPIEVLKKRDQKGLYSGIADGTTDSVVGMDLDLELPIRPDITLNNTGNVTPEKQACKLMEILGLCGEL